MPHLVVYLSLLKTSDVGTECWKRTAASIMSHRFGVHTYFRDLFLNFLLTSSVSHSLSNCVLFGAHEFVCSVVSLTVDILLYSIMVRRNTECYFNFTIIVKNCFVS